jgi:hypothetical protein
MLCEVLFDVTVLIADATWPVTCLVDIVARTSDVPIVFQNDPDLIVGHARYLRVRGDRVVADFLIKAEHYAESKSYPRRSAEILAGEGGPRIGRVMFVGGSVPAFNPPSEN